jgi:hypothetical protein
MSVLASLGPFYDPAGARDYLLTNYGIRRAVPTLAKLRCTRSDGPAFRKAGRTVLYAKADLDSYASHLLSERLHSTSNRGR